MPDDLVGIDHLAVDDGGHLAVAPAGVETDAAAVEMAARGARAALLRRRIRGIGGILDLKGALVLAGHEIAVKLARTAYGIGVANALVQRSGAGDDDLVSAVRPQHRLDDALDVGIVARVVDAVAEHVHGDRLGIAVVAHDGDGDSLRLRRGGDRLPERARLQRHRAELGIEHGLDLHTKPPRRPLKARGGAQSPDVRRPAGKIVPHSASLR